MINDFALRRLKSAAVRNISLLLIAKRVIARCLNAGPCRELPADAGCINCDDVLTQVFEELCAAMATDRLTSFQGLLAQGSAIAAGILAATDVCPLLSGGDDYQTFIEAALAAPP